MQIDKYILKATLLLVVVFIAQTAFTREIIRRPEKIRIAIIDTGIDQNHPKLKRFITHSEDFTETTPNGADRSGHGTHIAGIITQNLDSDLVSIINLKFYDPKFKGDTIQTTLLALQKAIDMNVNIINYSAGGHSANEKELELLKLAAQKGIVIITAAGNDGLSLKNQKYYPASYNLPNVLTVAAISQKRKLASFSNYDNISVDIAAPGENIPSTLPLSLNQFGTMSGTSQATAWATQKLTLVMMKSKGRIPALHAKRMLRFFGEKNQELESKVRTATVVEELKWPFELN